MTRWRAAVIAAGQGERLRAGGWRGSKAMLPVGGRSLVDHALDRLAGAGIGEVTVLLNDAATDAAEHLRNRPGVSLLVRTTPSSYASFALVAGSLATPAVVTTVDSILPDGGFDAFLTTAAGRQGLTLGVTCHVDDEKPLWVTLADDGCVTALGGDGGTHVTAGFYAWTRTLPAAGGDHDRLRDYLRWLVEDGFPVFGAEVPTVLDIDRPSDVAAATAALKRWERAA